MYTIKDLKNGKCAVINDGTLEELNEVLKRAFHSIFSSRGNFKYYFKSPSSNCWDYLNSTPKMPVQSVRDFLKPKYPKLMWVSDYSNFRGALKRVVFAEKGGCFIAWRRGSTLEEAEKDILTSHWKYAKDIEEPQIVELTFKDISEGKGVGVDPSLIRIKE